MTALDRIDVDLIQDQLPHDISCCWVESIQSTQTEVKRNSLLIAEHQSAGVGRRGNHWLTPTGRSICLSYRFELPLLAAKMAGYQITTALAIANTIHAFDPVATVQMKWPNDLYHHNKKFAGILINLIPKQQHTEIIVGIGINWQLTTTQLESIDQPVCNIPWSQRAMKQTPSRSHFIAQLIHQIEAHNQQFIQQGLSGFLSQWKKHDYLLNQKIQVSCENQFFAGYYQGINHQGELLLRTKEGIKTFCSGEVSVKAV